MRSKFGSEDHRQDWRCAFCCHVRTGTILLGIWHLILHVLALAIIAVVLIHPELVGKQHELSGEQTLLAVEPQNVKVYEYHYEYTFFKDCKWTTHDINVGMAVTFCTFLITVMCVYGAVKGNPRLLMPFFCLQVFDFCIASLTVIGYFSYMPDVRQTIADNPNLPFQKELLHLDAQWLSLSVLLTFVLLMMVKAYFIGVVWSCYKYLIYRNSACSMAEYIDADTQVSSNISYQNVSKSMAEYVDADNQVLLPPPDYEIASKDTKEIPIGYSMPPPPYTPQKETI